MNPNAFLTSAYGVRMPRIIYGTAWKKERTAALVEQAIGLGFRGIDTACQSGRVRCAYETVKEFPSKIFHFRGIAKFRAYEAVET